MFTERALIEERVYQVKQERRELKDEYLMLMQRLREIDNRDMNESSLDITERLATTVEKLSEVIPHIPVEAMVQQVAKNYPAEMVTIDENPKSEVQENVEKAAADQKENSDHAPVKLSRERCSSVIKEILEVNPGYEFKAKDIENEFYDRTGKKYSNFTKKIADAMEHFPSIEKASFGRYYIKPQNLYAM